MRRVLLGLAILLGALLGALGVALLLIEPDDLRGPLEASLSEVSGRRVELGALDLALTPLPALRMRNVVVQGPSDAEPRLAEVDEVRARLRLLPLLVGEVVLGAVEVSRPRLHLPTDPTGRPRLPAARGREPLPGGPEPARGGPLLAVDRIRITDGSVVAGDWRAEHLRLSGGLRLSGRAEFEFEVELPGVARLRAGRGRIEGLLGGGERQLALAARVEAGDLAGLASLLALGPGWAGRVDGDVDVRLRDGALAGGRAELTGTELRIRSAALSVEGEADLQAELGGGWRLDLERAAVALGERLRKPPGVELEATGTLPAPPIESLRGIAVTLPGSRIELAARVVPPIWVQLEPVDVALEPLAPLAGAPLGGVVRFERFQLELPPAARGALRLDRVRLPLEGGAVEVSGRVEGVGQQLSSERLELEIGGQHLVAAGSYDLERGRLSLRGEAREQDLEALAIGLTGRRDVAGLLTGEVHLLGPLGRSDPLSTLEGRGHVLVADGAVRGFSVLRDVLGGLAALPLLVARLRGADLERYEEEEFERLSASFTIGGGRLHTDDLLLVYRYGTAELRGSVGLADGGLDLSGRLTLADEVDRELGGAGARERVIPIAGVRGTLARPRVVLDREALVAFAGAYAEDEQVRESLDRVLGPGGAEAVEGLLEQLLRGGQRRKEGP